jgi:hypothetical protein
LTTTHAGAPEIPCGRYQRKEKSSGVRYDTYQVEELALDDENVKSVHDFFYRGGVLPEMHVEDVNVRRA